MEQVLVSVIVPVYNAEKYLSECIESLISQTYQNIEIILLPGQSNDDSTRICFKWAQKDTRILIIPQDKNCTGYARNKGILAANGKYIAFCDADDKMAPTYIEEMIYSAIINDSDIVECEYYNASEDLSSLTPYTILETLSGLPHSFYERFGSSSVWRYILKKSFWTENKFAFPETNRMEDLAIYSLLFAKAKKTSIIYKPLYVYRTNPHSVMHSSANIESVISNYTDIADYMVKEHKRLDTYSFAKETILRQLEYHGGYILDDYPALPASEKSKYEHTISDILKKMFRCNISTFEVKAFGWGSNSTGLLCNLLTKQHSSNGRYISKMTMRGMINANIKSQLEILLSDYAPNVIVVDLLEETDYLINYQEDIMKYLEEWALGVKCFSDTLKKNTPCAHIFIIEKYLATKHLINGNLIDYAQIEDIGVLNELLVVMYQTLRRSIPNNTFIGHIPSSERYSLSNDPKDGHNYDQTYYNEKIMDALHFK